MAGLRKPTEYDWRDSNVELIGSDLDHRVKYNSAASEPAWHEGGVGKSPGLFVWRIEKFEVVPWPKEKYGQFFDGDSFIVLHSFKIGQDDKLGHEVFFWLGEHTSQDEAGTAAYKTVELDEFLGGAATQHREVQAAPSEDFLALFPRISIRAGGIETGFRQVEEEPQKEILTLLRVFKNPSTSVNGIVVYEVEPRWQSLDDGDVFILDTGDKIWVWQGKDCSPMEKAKAAQVVHDMTLAKHVDVEVISQLESRSRRIIDLLGGSDESPTQGLHNRRPVTSQSQQGPSDKSQKLFRLSDASGKLEFSLVKESSPINASDLDGNDVFLLDDASRAIWVWEGQGASRAEKKKWLQVAQSYIRWLQETQAEPYMIPIAKVSEGYESRAFKRAIAA